MAPKSRRAAPSTTIIESTIVKKSTKTKPSQESRQTQLRLKSALGRVTKSSTRSGLKVKFSDAEKGALEGWTGNENANCVVETETSEPKQASQHVVKTVSKRKWADVVESESETENVVQDKKSPVKAGEQNKKLRLSSLKVPVSGNNLSAQGRLQNQEQLLSPPASRDGTDCDEQPSVKGRFAVKPRNRRTNAALSTSIVQLPNLLLDLISMHAAFLKALSLHFAHNGASTPSELTNLMDSTTRLWKKQTVRRDAIQRMLAMYEVAADSTLLGQRQVEQVRCPFKIVTSGLGSSVRTNLEYVGQSPFSELALQASFSELVYDCFKCNPCIDDNTNLPLLTVMLGTQTLLQRAKAASTRAEILNLSASAQLRSTPDFSKLSIADPTEHTPLAVKSRTLSLFDRVRAKGLANSNNVAPTAEQITRRHAIGRIGEIVDFLRMKQQQKSSTQFYSSVHGSPGKARDSGKASFSLGAIVRDIRQSVGVPMGEEEVKVCLRILSRELPGDWCRIIEFGSVVSITLQGKGMSGVEVRRLIEQKSLAD